jgi:hypothetical protein
MGMERKASVRDRKQHQLGSCFAIAISERA